MGLLATDDDGGGDIIYILPFRQNKVALHKHDSKRVAFNSVAT